MSLSNAPAGAWTVAALRGPALENRQDVAAAYWRCQASLASLNQARDQRIPWLSFVEGSYSHAAQDDNRDAAGHFANADPGESFTVDDNDDTAWAVEAAVVVPFFSLGSGATRVQKADYQRYLAVMGMTTRQVQIQLEDAVSTLQQTESRASESKADLAPRLAEAESTLAEMERRTDLGPLELTRVKEIILQFKRSILQTEWERRLARIRLTEVFGSELPTATEAAEPALQSQALTR